MDLKQLGDKGAPYTNVFRRCIYRGDSSTGTTALAVNDVVALDTTLISGNTTYGYQPTPGTSTGNSVTATTGVGGASQPAIDLMYSSVITALGESDTAGQIYCVVTDLLGGAGAIGTEVVVCIQGRVTVKTASATYTPGQLLMMSATETNRELVAFAAGTTDGQRQIAMVETGGTSATTCVVAFNGYNGLLSSQATTN